jgi:hypothetical protein
VVAEGICDLDITKRRIDLFVGGMVRDRLQCRAMVRSGGNETASQTVA